jgi:hypothetical protein
VPFFGAATARVLCFGRRTHSALPNKKEYASIVYPPRGSRRGAVSHREEGFFHILQGYSAT